MTAKTHKIETPAGVVTTRTASRFIAIRGREREMFVAHAVGRSWIRVAAAHTEAEAREKAAAEIRRRAIECERVEVFTEKTFAEVVKRSDSVEVARKAVAKGGGDFGFVFDTETGARV